MDGLVQDRFTLLDAIQTSFRADGVLTSGRIDELKKEIIAEYKTRAPAKMQEFLLQWQQRHDDRCVNDMLHVRIRSSFLKDFEPIKWSPNG